MAKSDVDRVTEEKVGKGGILLRLYFDIQDNQKDRLQPILADLINQHLMKEKGIVYCFGAIEEPIEKGGVYITSATVTALFDSFIPLVSVAFKYSPAGIEILKPDKDMRLNTNQLQSILMDVSQMSSRYSSYILEKVLSPEDVERMKSQMDRRAEMGKKFLEDGEKKGSDK